MSGFRRPPSGTRRPPGNGHRPFSHCPASSSRHPASGHPILFAAVLWAAALLAIAARPVTAAAAAAAAPTTAAATTTAAAATPAATAAGSAKADADQPQVFSVTLVPNPPSQSGQTSPPATAPTTGAPAGTTPSPTAATATPASPSAATVPMAPMAPTTPGRAAAAGLPRPTFPAARANRAANGGVSSYLWLLPAVLAAALLVGRLLWRRRPRRCPDCGATLLRLDREAAFAELDMAERTEQLVGDVRYEVFRCPACARIDKRGTARDLSAQARGAGTPPVGSAAFLRRRAQAGLSIWSPPAGKPGVRTGGGATGGGTLPGDATGDGISGGLLPPQ